MGRAVGLAQKKLRSQTEKVELILIISRLAQLEKALTRTEVVDRGLWVARRPEN